MATTVSFKFNRELRLRDKFQETLKSNYSHIINELVQNPDNFRYIIDDLYRVAAISNTTRSELLDLNVIQRAEKLFQHIAFSNATSMRKFIVSFQKYSPNLYGRLINGFEMSILNETTETNGSLSRRSVSNPAIENIAPSVVVSAEKCPECKLVKQQVSEIIIENAKLKKKLDSLESQFKKFLSYQNQFTEAQFMKIAKIEAKLLLND